MSKYLRIDSIDASVEKFLVALDGQTEVEVEPIVNDDGTKGLMFDITDVAIGEHTAVIGVDNGWERVYDDPFVFTRPPIPQPPFGVYLYRG